MQKFNKLSIVIVNYRSVKYLKKCLASIFAVWGREYEIIVVNNDENESLASVIGTFPAIIIAQRQKNSGFGTAQNAGIKIAQGKYILCLNPDTEVLEKIEKILEYFEKNPEIAIIGPKLVNNSGRAQQWIAGAEINLWRLIKNKLSFFKDKQIQENNEITVVDWVSGGAMFIRKETFERVHGFDEKFFMYYEDMDFCKRVRQAGEKVLYFPSVSIKHIEGGSSENKTKQKKYYYESQDYYFKKHLGAIQSKIAEVLRIFFT